MVLTSGLMVLAQKSEDDTVPASSSIACPADIGKPSTAPHTSVAVSAGMVNKYRIGGKNPKYPADAKRNQIEGRVMLVATVSSAGKVEDICVSQGPEALQQAAFSQDDGAFCHARCTRCGSKLMVQFLSGAKD